MQGIVESYNQKHQFGSINYNVAGFDKNAFCNRIDLANAEYLIKGDKVEFTLGEGGRARDVHLLVKKDVLRW